MYMKYEIKKLSPFRVLSINGYEAVGAGHNMHALVEMDVTDVRRELREMRREGRRVSFFGYILSAIAKTIDENKEMNLIRKGKKLYCFDEVDIDIPIELEQAGEPVPRKYVVRDAASKTPEEITKEVEEAKASWKETGIVGEEDEWAHRWMKLASHLPGWLCRFVFRRFSKNVSMIKEHFGTTFVSSVSGFSDVSGFIVPFFGGQSRPLAFALGSLTQKPGVVGTEIQIREFLSMTITINHDLVDGAPAARFVNRLKQRIEGKVGDWDFNQ